MPLRPEEIAFLTSQDPDIDTTRRVHADWLEERGATAKAEYIRLQADLAATDRDDSRRGGWRRRERKLLEYPEVQNYLQEIPDFWRKFIYKELLVNSISAPGLQMNGDLPQGITMPITDFLRLEQQLLEKIPASLTRLRLTGPITDDHFTQLSRPEAPPILARFRDLSLNWAVDAWVAAENLANFLTNCKNLCNIERLSLRNNPLDEEDDDGLGIVLQALSQTDKRPRLQSLNLSGCNIARYHLGMLLNSKTHLNLQSLIIRNNFLGDSEIILISEAEKSTSLRRLDLSHNYIDYEGSLALAHSPHLTKLRILDLENNNIGRRAAKVLLDSTVLSQARIILTDNANLLPEIDNSAAARAVRKRLNDEYVRMPNQRAK